MNTDMSASLLLMRELQHRFMSYSGVIGVHVQGGGGNMTIWYLGDMA